MPVSPLPTQRRRAGDRDPRRSEMDSLNRRMDKQDEILGRVNTALFSQDASNEFGQPGLMATARNLDGHIKAVCFWARVVRAVVVSTVGGLIALGTLGKAFGFL